MFFLSIYGRRVVPIIKVRSKLKVKGLNKNSSVRISTVYIISLFAENVGSDNVLQSRCLCVFVLLPCYFVFVFSLQLCVYCPYIITTIPKSTYTYVNQLTLSCRIDAIVYTLQFDVAFIMEQKGEMCIMKRESDILMNTNINTRYMFN